MFKSAESTFASLWLLLVFCFWVTGVSVLVFRITRLKTGRYKSVIGHVTMIHDVSGRYSSINQRGRCATVEYKAGLETYRKKFNNFLRGASKPEYCIGQSIKLIYDTKNPHIVFQRYSVLLNTCLTISSIMLIFGILSLIKALQ